MFSNTIYLQHINIFFFFNIGPLSLKKKSTNASNPKKSSFNLSLLKSRGK